MEQILSPSGEKLHLNCSVIQSCRQSWRIELSDRVNDPITTGDDFVREVLNNSGIQVSIFSTHMSQLVFTGVVEVNATVACLARCPPDFILSEGNHANIIIYGKLFSR